jgi:phage baseplate assembly protein W
MGAKMEAEMSFDIKIISGDLVLQNGDLRQVTNSEKLIQDILKICLTEAGSNPLHPWYGSFISRTLVGNPNQTSMLAQIGKSQLNTALTNLQQLQNLQLQSFQRVSAAEQLAAILNISVLQSQINPTLFNITVQVLSKGLTPVTTNFMVNTIT